MMGSVTQLSASKQQIRCADAVLLLVVPSVLFGIHAWLPAGVSSRLVFTYGDPTLTTVWTAAAIHDSPAHLTANLGWYGLVVGAAYLVYVTWGRRRLFWLLYGALLVVAPLTTVAIDYWLLYQRWGLVGPDSIAFGFSGVVSAFGGLLVVGLFGVIAEWYTWPVSTATTVAFVASGVGIVLYQSPLLANPSTVVPVAGILVAIGFVSLRWWDRDLTVRRWLSAHRPAIVLAGTCGVVISALVAGMFSIEPASGGRFPNVIAHGTGFVTGVCVAGGGLLSMS